MIIKNFMDKLLQFKKHLLLLLLCAGSFVTASAQMIKGTVADKENGDPLIGATVTVKNGEGFKRAMSVGLDGSFVFRNLPPGKYEVEAKYVSYKDDETNVNLQDGGIEIVKLLLLSKAAELTEVRVKGTADRTSDQSARKLEQRSSQVLNAVSAHTIEISPDITVANVTQRVSGVTIQRSNNGEGQYAIIRGMEKRYTYTLVNGFKIPSPDNKNRYIPLDIFPADIIDRLEVYKSLTPSMEGDAIAGGINLALKQAPDDFTVSANLGAGLSQSVMNEGFTNFGNNNVSLRSPRAVNGDNYVASLKDFTNNGQHFSNSKLPIGTIANLSVGGRTADKKFGALVSLSYQNVYKNTDGVFFGSDVDEQNRPSLTEIQRRKYSIEQERSSVIGRFDYKFDGRNKLGFDAAYINLTQNQYRFVSDTSLTLARTGVGFGRVTQDPRSQRDVQHIYDFTLHGENRLSDNFSLNYTGKYSKATANENRYDLNLITSRTLVSGAIVQAPVTIDASAGQSQIFSYNSDEDKSGYLNFVYTPKIGDTKVEFTAGGMYRNKTRNSTYDKYAMPLDHTKPIQNYDGNIDHNTFELVAFAQGTPTDPLNYDFTENIGAGFGQFKFNLDKLEILGGARYEHTSQSYFDAVPASQEGKTGSIKYFDILPSLNLKYLLSDKENLRVSYYSAISRPNFYELVPHSTGDPDADYQEKGNPHLKRATADNFDIRYEFFPKPLDQLLVGVFYKNIVNPIEYALVNLKAAGSAGYALEAENFGTAHNYGFEADFTKYIRNFGFRANYSYTNSSITTTKAEKYRDATTNEVKDRQVEQTRPLQGQSKNVGNLSLLYKDTKTGLDAQVSAVYTGERINSVSDYLNNDIWQKGFVTLDVSAEKRIVKGLYVYAKATNLTNTPYQLFVKLPYPPLDQPGKSGQAIEYQQAGKNTFIRKDTYNQYYILGLHYKF
jgi:TonB-dependent receptor